MKPKGVEVEWDTVPTSIKIADASEKLKSASNYVIKVCYQCAGVRRLALRLVLRLFLITATKSRAIPRLCMPNL